jgi:hypothetical protein
VVALARLGFCAKGHRLMSRNPATTAATAGNVPARVRLKRINCQEAEPYPPDGQAREWRQRLKNAFGTTVLLAPAVEGRRRHEPFSCRGARLR